MEYNPEDKASRTQLAAALVSKLDSCGFSKEDDRGTREAVYGREVHNTDGSVRVLVYTTVIQTREGIEVRYKGKDAIRVCVVYRSKRQGRDVGLSRETRVHRTGKIEEVVKRMYNRMREAYGSVSSNKACPKCGSPTFINKSGRATCSEICWKSDAQLDADNRRWQQRKRRRRSWKRWS